MLGCKDDEQLASVGRALDAKILQADTSGLLKSLTLVIGQYYILTTNIDVANGLANGIIRKLVHVK